MKNKYQEALDCVLSTEKRPYVDWHLSVEELQELVDKEMPMKPVHKEQSLMFSDVDWWECPKCTKTVELNKKYCGNCGQKLDWSDCNE